MTTARRIGAHGGVLGPRASQARCRRPRLQADRSDRRAGGRPRGRAGFMRGRRRAAAAASRRAGGSGRRPGPDVVALSAASWVRARPARATWRRRRLTAAAYSSSIERHLRLGQEEVGLQARPGPPAARGPRSSPAARSACQGSCPERSPSGRTARPPGDRRRRSAAGACALGVGRPRHASAASRAIVPPMARSFAPGLPPAYRGVLLAGVLPVRAWGRLRVDGLEHLPATGPVLLAGNHDSYWDPIVVGDRGARPRGRSTRWPSRRSGRRGPAPDPRRHGPDPDRARRRRRRRDATGRSRCCARAPASASSPRGPAPGRELRARSGFGRLAAGGARGRGRRACSDRGHHGPHRLPAAPASPRPLLPPGRAAALRAGRGPVRARRRACWPRSAPRRR